MSCRSAAERRRRFSSPDTRGLDAPEVFLWRVLFNRLTLSRHSDIGSVREGEPWVDSSTSYYPLGQEGCRIELGLDTSLSHRFLSLYGKRRSR